MKTKFNLLLFVFLISENAYAKTPLESNVIRANNDSIANNFSLYPTTNIWTFIKLNTTSGQIWQVQYGMEKNSRAIFDIYTDSLLLPKSKIVQGRFKLYPTQNIYTFILLDQIDGRTWQVQWSIEPEKRGIVPIN
ncbi:MAG: hypothetical protein RLZZ60_616 [Bacteroidota bacterium]